MRVLVVGGTGFIGGHVARAFRGRGDEVTALVRDLARARSDARLQGARLVQGTALAQEELPAQDVIVYAAGAWLPNDTAPQPEIERRSREVYVDNVSVLAEAARRWGAHFIFMSGTSRYGFIEAKAVAEDTPPVNLSVFGFYKRQAEATLASTPGLRWTAVTPPEVYGARDPGSYLTFVYERVRARRFFLIGRGDNRWSLCNVQNVADAIVAVAPGDGHGVLNISDARPWTQRELATAVAKALGRAPIFPRLPRSLVLAAATLAARIPGAGPRLTPNHVRVRTCDILLDTSKATRLGIVPHAGLAEGVVEAVRWWERQRFSVYQFSPDRGVTGAVRGSPKSS
jgi:nucleoside-diphosphate-sugar epimerase